MTYQLVKFEYKHFSYSRAEVIHLPNWFEKLRGKRAELVTYIGWVDFWMNEVTYTNASFKVRALITTEWHNHDLKHFKLKFSKRHDNH